MKMTSEQLIAASRQRVWAALNDPEILRASLPGCQSLERESDDRFAATMEVKVGPIGARFKSKVSLIDLDPPNGYILHLEGNGGIAGSVKGSAKIRLRENAGGTVVSYDVDAQLGGRMAQLGGALIDATANQFAARFFDRFGELMGAKPKEGGAKPEEPGAKPAGPARAKLAASSVGAQAAQFAAASAASGTLPVAWILAIVVAALVGFLVGRGEAAAGSDWAGLAIGLLVIVVAGAAFEYGRRSAAPVLMLDGAALRWLIDGAKD